MEIAVLGGGHGSFAAAASLADQGHAVRLWRRDAQAFLPVLDGQSINLLDSRGERDVPLAIATTDLHAAVADARLIVIPLPATSHTTLGPQLAPHLSDGQVVFLPPGTFGSFLFARALKDSGNPARVCFAETGTLPYLARKRGPRSVAVSAYATRLPTGVFPASRAGEAFDILKQAFPAVERLVDALDGALMNAGPIIHPPLIMMNTGPLEHFASWDIHNEGTQPSIRRVTDALDAERIRIREMLGYRAPHFPLADHYSSVGDEWMYGNAAHEKLTDSGDWREHIDLTRHRYMLEDVELGLAFLDSCARLAGVAAPTVSGLLALGSAICGRNFAHSGRTLANLGLERLGWPSLRQLLREGWLE